MEFCILSEHSRISQIEENYEYTKYTHGNQKAHYDLMNELLRKSRRV